ncbi:MAG: UTP--glucose-1-phosphate uridylyltransferase, partial [candidate division KSB1 bacterium]|nr:UTP--glucose-1-phosphate uridylyltransferase [candidate division KSB1 bacterium]
MIPFNDEQNQQILNRVHQAGQGHVLRFWNELSQQSRTKLLNQLNSIDFHRLRELCEKYVFHPERRLFRGELEPVDIIRLPRTDEQRRKAQEARQVGEGALRAGKVAALLVAGGQGTRLGFDGPKGMFPIGPVSGKSLFQLLAEKIRAVAKRYDTTIAWYIMTSEANHQQTKEFFQRHNNFGLPEVFFFQQDMVPSVDTKGKLLLEARDRIVTSPNGHGGSLSALKNSGALDDMRSRGIELIFYFQVDNVLLKMCDPVFLGYHLLQGAEMSAKVIQKRDPYEKMGVVGRLNNRLAVIEYSNLSREDMEATNPDGSLKYSFGSIAIHILNVDFVERENLGGLKLPYHLA